ncbi:MAG: ATP synthase subunit A, partial [Phycisphaerae bacterium SM23_33]
MESVTGRIVAVFGNMVTAELDHDVVQNAVAYCCRGDGRRLLSEVIRVRGNRADLQVFEETRGLKVGDHAEFTSEMLSVVLGPGLLGQVYDGLQNPLYQVGQTEGYFLTPGVYVHALDTQKKWQFTPAAEPGQVVAAGDTLGTVPEGIFEHQLMVPFGARDEWNVEKVAPGGEYTVEEEIATLSRDGETMSVTMQQKWPVKVPLNVSEERQ